MTSFIQYRAYIGPRFDDYDWTNLNTDAVVDLDIDTTLASDVNSGVTSAQLSSGSGFPSAAGVFLGPSAASNQQGWEYCKYTSGGSTLSGLIREPAATREHNGVHSAGAPVYLWYPVMTNTGDFTFSWQLNQTYAASQWEATIGGVRFVHGVFLNNHLCAIQYRTNLTGSWKILCVGFIDSPSVQDDFKSYANWNMRVVSSPQVLERQPSKGVHIGNVDIAKQGNASGTPELRLAADERQSGDYIAAAPNFSPSSIVDEDGADTLWIGERFHGPEQTFLYPSADVAQNQGGIRFSQIYLNPPPGTPPGARWIELVKLTGTYQGQSINAADPLSFQNTYIWTLPSASGIGDEEPIVLVENEAVYRELNPIADPAAIFENRTFFGRLTATGGALWLRVAASNSWENYVRWGTGNGDIQHEDATDKPWVGPALPVQGYGQTYRYIHGRTGVTNSKDWYDVGMVKTPGYNVAEDYDSYVMVSLPGLDLQLSGDISASAPAFGGQLLIKDKAGNPSVAGLDPTGQLQIGDEQFNYSVKSNDGYVVLSSSRGSVNGTSAAAHKDGDAVFVVVGGVKTDAPLISQISWHHYNGTIHLRDFTVHRSALVDDPRSPEDDASLIDWVSVANVTGNTGASWSHTFSPSQRIKHILIRIARVNGAPARPRINDFKAILDTSAYISGLWLASGQSAYGLVRQIILNAGFPGNSIVSVGSGHPVLDNLTTADDKAWTVAADIADFAGCRLLTDRDSKMAMAVDTYWTTTPSPSHTWTKANAGNVEKIWSNGLGVSQIKLPWRTADGATKGVEVYPATPSSFGEVMEQKEHVYASASSAQVAARKYYCLYRYPYTAVVDLPDGDLSVKPGQIHRLQWLFADSPRELNRLYMVTGVEHHIVNATSQLSTSISLAQIDREAEN